MEEFQKKLIKEYRDLEEKKDKLGEFTYKLENETSMVDLYHSLYESGELFAMQNQFYAMSIYLNMLQIRCEKQGIFTEIYRQNTEE